jgi:hypothetical protein
MPGEIVDAEGSRSSAPEVRLWGERTGDRSIGRHRSYSGRGIYPSCCGIEITWPTPDLRTPRGIDRAFFAKLIDGGWSAATMGCIPQYYN